MSGSLFSYVPFFCSNGQFVLNILMFSGVVTLVVNGFILVADKAGAEFKLETNELQDLREHNFVQTQKRQNIISLLKPLIVLS